MFKQIYMFCAVFALTLRHVCSLDVPNDAVRKEEKAPLSPPRLDLVRQLSDPVNSKDKAGKPISDSSQHAVERQIETGGLKDKASIVPKRKSSFAILTRVLAEAAKTIGVS